MNQDYSSNFRQDHFVGDIVVKGNKHYLDFSQKQFIQISIEEIKTRELIVTSPYKGLKSFEAEDKDRFFGRDQFLHMFAEVLQQTNLILLLGASGSGKSSVIRAGVIPQLSKKYGASFIHHKFRPDRDPFESLYAKLLDNYKQEEANIARLKGPNTLIQVVTKLKSPGDVWLLFIDQFEELFTICQSQERDKFITSLVKLVNYLTKNKDVSVKIIGTMRADYLDKLSPYSKFLRLTDQYRPCISEMQPDELRLVIEQPAAQHGVVFESGLVEEIIKDVQGQAGYLPLLQYTLNLLWEKEVENGNIYNRCLYSKTFRLLGGVRGALQQQMNQFYNQLSKHEKIVTQRIFLKLVDICADEGSGTDWRPIRKRALKSDFCDAIENVVLSKLVNKNLLISNTIIKSGKEPKNRFYFSSIEIAHDILLSSWSTLNNWIIENRQAIALRNRLNNDLLRWQVYQKDEELWIGSKLEHIIELSRNENFNQVLGGLSSKAKEFISASIRFRNRKRRVKWGIVFSIFTFLIAFIIQQNRIGIEKEYSRAIFLKDDKLLRILPKFLPEFMDEATQAVKENDINTAYYYYQRILELSNQLLATKNLDRSLKDIPTKAEKSLSQLIIVNELPKLKYYLKIKKLGKINEDFVYGATPEKNYEPGALKTTYSILMTSAGARADLNQDGLLSTLLEANQLPCDILLRIEKLWKDNISQSCGWESGFSSKCIDDKTLTASIFDFPSGTELALKRVNYCKNSV